MLMLMLALCGCRTRLTNNTSVSNTVDDEYGYLQESYQYRRDELGLPTAETPIFTGTSDEVDEEFDYDEGTIDYEPQEPEEFDDTTEPESTETTTTTTSGTTTTTNTTSRPTVRRSTTTTRRTTTTNTSYKVTLDANGGKCSKSYIYVKKGSKYGTLPDASKEGKNFEGWFTAKTGGSQVTSKTKVKSDKAHTLYAHYGDKKTYTISFDGNGESDNVELSANSISVTEDGEYGTLPTAKRAGYVFDGWYTEAGGGKQVKSGDSFSANANQTLFAHWTKDPYTWWDNEFKNLTNDASLSAAIYLDDVDIADDRKTDLIKACKGTLTTEEESPQYAVKFVSNMADGSAVQAAIDSLREKFPEATIIIVSQDSVKGKDPQKLLYKLHMINTLYGVGADTSKAASELETDAIPPQVFEAGASEGE